MPLAYVKQRFKSYFFCSLRLSFFRVIVSDTCVVMLQQAYEGLQTALKLKQEYVFLPAKLKEVYLTYLLEHLKDHKVQCHTTDSLLLQLRHGLSSIPLFCRNCDCSYNGTPNRRLLGF